MIGSLFALSYDGASSINLSTTATHISWSSRFKHNARTLVYVPPWSTSVPAYLACPIAVDVAFKDIQDSVRLFPQHWTLTAVGGTKKKASWGQLEASDALKKISVRSCKGRRSQSRGKYFCSITSSTSCITEGFVRHICLDCLLGFVWVKPRQGGGNIFLDVQTLSRLHKTFRSCNPGF